MPRRALQQAHAETRFDLFDRIRHRRAGQTCVFGGQREAAPLDDQQNTRMASDLSICLFATLG